MACEICRLCSSSASVDGLDHALDHRDIVQCEGDDLCIVNHEAYLTERMTDIDETRSSAVV